MSAEVQAFGFCLCLKDPRSHAAPARWSAGTLQLSRTEGTFPDGKIDVDAGAARVDQAARDLDGICTRSGVVNLQEDAGDGGRSHLSRPFVTSAGTTHLYMEVSFG